ncbi:MULTISPECIES: hypothetical protein [unclassified Haladaptatus]|uniref:hypothetical protein n=1 Tax=unclassified Haladaptatus TaxID=2622732 RepID=UPI00209C0B62|nr:MULTISPECIES: hypothetical protein [unclassified Haladaptatus]MCO8246432.1 hypothetical protein [Haladaptatus sp. AB643]MCO8254669.1 hypothetical protein [Haladaptatus sp. AB618]
MGFLELHLHEPNFTLNTGEAESSGMFGWKKHEHGKHGKHKHGKHGKHKHGKHGKHEAHDEGSSVTEKLAPILFLVVAAAVARRLRHRRE